MTECRHDAMASIAQACRDGAETMALSIIRMIAAGYSTGDVACWDMAHAAAERSLPSETAGKLVGSVTTLLRALRTERSREWYFMPVSCCRVTGDEAGIIRLMSAARDGGDPGVAEAAVDVTGARTSPRTQAAAAIVAGVLDEIAGDFTLGAPGRRATPPRIH